MANSLPQRFGEYEVERQLGTGGFGKVYLARDTILDRQVALKVLHADLVARPNIVRRFLREAKAMAKLKHENIVTIYQLGNDPLHPPYIVMEFIDGMSLAQHLATRQGRHPLQEAIRILRPVAAALDAAHQQGMIHRDVKPANVLISSSGHVKLTDFGIVKMLQEDETTLTGTNQRIGTPYYMAPEQADVRHKAEIGPASDIYSLAVMSYQMITGRVPFRGGRDAVMFAHINTPPPHPHDLNPYLPDGVAGDLLKALDKDPKKRHATARSFVNALEKAASSQNTSRIGSTLPTSLPTDLSTSLPTDQLTNSPTDQLTNPPTIPRSNELTNPPSLQHSTLQPPNWLPLVAFFVAILIVGGLFGYMINPNGEEVDSGSATVLATAEPAIEEPTATEVTVPPTMTLFPTDIPTRSEQSRTPIPALVAGATRVAEDGMIQVYVPEGEFLMGASEDDENAEPDEFPQHTVYLAAYWIDQTEVTNEMYRTCVDVGRCNAPLPTSYYDNSEYSSHPVVYVSWDDATTYCQWAQSRLPTEAEWEKAARGTDGRIYPWGDKTPTTAQANFEEYVGDTTQVASYPTGASPYGAYDMMGNVWEWVNDWYDENYYESSYRYAPLGPSEGQEHVLRGGSWLHVARDLRAPNRTKGVASDRDNSGGFRCASD